MNSDLYRLQYRGDTDEGHSVGEVKKNLATLFKVSPERIERLFSGPPVTIKKNIDHPTALKYQEAMKRAGAISSIMPMETDNTTLPDTSVTVESGSRKVIAAKKVRGELAYSPILCTSLSGNAATFDLNRADMRNIPFSAIRLVSVFREQPDPDSPAIDSMALYIEDSKRPFLLKTDQIRFAGFPDVAEVTLVRSVQNFIRFLSRNNDDMCIDHETEQFLSDSQYMEIVNQLDHLTALGEALENAHNPEIQ